MRHCASIVLLIAGWIGLSSERGAAADRPHVLIILADDLGYSDVGCYGGEIETPHLDALADGGLRFTQFYNTARCWPTRAALLTGYYAQQIRRDDLPGVKRGERPDWAPLLPQRLQPLGYRTYHSGKWHLDGQPLNNGFDRSYDLRDHNRFFHPRQHTQDDQPLSPVAPGAGYYATTAITNHALECLKDHAERFADRPFFCYLAYTAPHFPLHALPEDIARYDDVYGAGWEEVRRRRWERIQQLGIVRGALSQVERDVGPPYHFAEALEILGPGEVNRPLPWQELTPQQQQFQAAKMAVHAAMVHRMDREIGRVLDQLRAMKALENTLILFLSDNGASAEIMVRGDGHDPQAAAGSAATYLCLGPGWSTTANTPFRRHKTWVHEGGIATPLIVHWPQGFADRGELRNSPGHVIDVVPTILELTGGAQFGEDRPPQAAPWPGISLAAEFASAVQSQRPPLWWSHEGNRAIRRDNWKLVAARGHPWELYDLTNDRAETHNVAAEHPDLVRDLSTLWQSMEDEFQQRLLHE